MGDFTCPICGSTKCKNQDFPNDYSQIQCEQGYRFNVSDEIFQMSPTDRDRIYNLIFEYLLRSPKLGNKLWHFYYDKLSSKNPDAEPVYVNLFAAMQAYPNNFMERANRTLNNLAILYPQYGYAVGGNYVDIHATYSTGEFPSMESTGFFELMVELGYLAKHKSQTDIFVVSAVGWLKCEELKKQQQEIKQGFVAMSFQPETASIREAFRKAIASTGYAVRVIDEKEHNNQIVPEIFYEIGRSKFVVVDVTYPNHGAYYEAGYALGVGKQVIVCCKKEVFENKGDTYIRPHFDISQKSMIIWDDESDLTARLIRRIEATVN